MTRVVGHFDSSSAQHDSGQHGIGGFFHNVGQGLKDAGAGLLVGTYELGKAGVHDAVDAFNGGGFHSHLAPIAHAIISDYKTRYSPLVHGDFNTFGHQLYAHPVDYALDALTVADGAGGALAKAGKLSAKYGSGSLAGLAGLHKVDLAPAAFKDLATQPQARAILGGSGQQYAAKTKAITSKATGKALHEKYLPANPVKRGRAHVVEAALSKIPADAKNPALNYFGSDRRGNRLTEKAAQRIAIRQMHREAQPMVASVKALSKFEQKALFYRAQGISSLERRMKLVKKRQATVEDPAASAMDKAHAQLDLHTLLHPKVAKAIDEPSQNMLKAQDHLHGLSEHSMAQDAKSFPHLADIHAGMKNRMLDLIGVQPAEGEKISFISHSYKPNKAGSAGASVSTKGLQAAARGEMKKASGKSVAVGAYRADPMAVVRVFKNGTHQRIVNDRIKRALAQSLPLNDVAAQDHLVNDASNWIALRPGTQAHDALQAKAKSALDFINNDLHPNLTVVPAEHAQELAQSLAQHFGGDGMVMPRGAYHELASQLHTADDIKGQVIKKGVDLWRDAALGLRPGFYANNGLGNLVLSTLAHGHPLGILKPSAYGKGDLGRRIDNAAPDLVHTSHAAAGGVADVHSGLSRPVAFAHDQVQKLMAVGAKPTENNFRRAAFGRELSKQVRSFRAAQPGATRADAIDAILSNEHAVDQLGQKVYGDLLDYSNLTPIEQQYMRAIFPFWNFVRSMTGRSVKLVGDEPWKAIVMAQISKKGLDANNQALGQLPDYLRAVLRIKDLGGGRVRIIPTYGANPFSTPADVVGQLQSLGTTDPSGGNNPLASTNPFLKAGIESLTKKDSFSGADITAPHIGSHLMPSSTAGIYLTQLANAIPQVGAYTRYENPSMFPAVQRGLGDTLAQQAGVGTGTLNLPNVRRNQAIQAMVQAKANAAQLKRQAKSEAARRKYGR